MIKLTTLTSLLQLQNLVAAVLTSASDSLSFSETLMRRVVMILVIMINTKWSSPTGHWPHICWTKVKYYCHCHHHHHHHHHQLLFVLPCKGVLFVGQGYPMSYNNINKWTYIHKLCELHLFLLKIKCINFNGLSSMLILIGYQIY